VLISVVSEETFEVEVGRCGGRDWVRGVAGRRAGGLIFEMDLVEGVLLESEIEIEGDGFALTVLCGGFEPLELTWEKITCDFSKVTAQLRPKKSTLTINLPLK